MLSVAEKAVRPKRRGLPDTFKKHQKRSGNAVDYATAYKRHVPYLIYIKDIFILTKTS